MAGIMGDVINNRLGLQALAQGRQQIQEQEKQAIQQQEASDYLRKYYQSQKDGAPDYESLNEAVLRSPQLAQNALAAMKIDTDEKAKSAADFLIKANQFVDSPEDFMALGRSRVEEIIARGGDPSETLGMLEAYASGDIGKVKNGIRAGTAALTNRGYIDPSIYGQMSGGGADVQQAQYVEGLGYVQQLRNGQVTMQELTPEQQAKVKLALEAQANRQASAYGQKVTSGLQAEGELKPGVEGSVESSKIRSREAEKERQNYVRQGIAAKTLLKQTDRLLELNNLISTGKTAPAIKAMGDIFNIKSPNQASLGEFRSLAGQMVLGQIKQLGSNPTEGERAYLNDINASLNQGTEVNEAILNNLRDIQQRQLDRAKWFSRNPSKTIEDYLLENEDFAPVGGSGQGAMTTGINGDTKNTFTSKSGIQFQVK